MMWDLRETDDIAFAISVLRERKRLMANPDHPLRQRIDTAIDGLERMADALKDALERAEYHYASDEWDSDDEDAYEDIRDVLKRCGTPNNR